MSFSGAFAGDYGGAWGGKPEIAPIGSIFDHGLGKPQRTIVRDAVVDMLARLHVANGGYLQAIEPTSTIVRGPGDENGLDLIFDQLQGRDPSVMVAVGDKEYKPAGTDVKQWQGALVVHVYFFSKNLRSRLARLQGDAQSVAVRKADPGLETVMEHVEQLLVGEIPGGVPTKSSSSPIKDLRPVSEGQLGDSNEVEVWHQTYVVWVSRSIREKRDLSLELKTISTYHRLVSQQPADAPIVTQTTDVTP